MTLTCLRRDLPASYSFQVTELPYDTKLDQNESPVDLPAELKQDLAAELASRPWNRYIQPAEYTAAKRALAEVFELDPDRLAITVGADQAIEAAFLIAGGPGRWARWFAPTYPYIAHAARRTFTEGGPVDLGADLHAELDATAIDASPRADLIALVSPNNPTGGLLADGLIATALAERNRLVLVDEAYYDFSRHSVVGMGDDADNLFVVRSLSKSSIAGIHLGFAVAHPDAVRAVERMYTAPYQLDAMQLIVARRYGELAPHVQANAARVVDERRRLMTALGELEGVDPYPSHANFILFRVAAGDAAAVRVHRRLAETGVRIRNVGALPGLAGYLRVTIGTPEENDRFLAKLYGAINYLDQP